MSSFFTKESENEELKEKERKAKYMKYTCTLHRKYNTYIRYSINLERERNQSQSLYHRPRCPGGRGALCGCPRSRGGLALAAGAPRLMDVDIAVDVEATAGVTVDTEMDVCPPAGVVGETATDADTCVDAAVDVDETMALACCCCCRAGATESAPTFSAPAIPLVLVIVLLMATALVVVVVEAVVGVEVGGIEEGVVRGIR